jgi:hypothetical protein
MTDDDRRFIEKITGYIHSAPGTDWVGLMRLDALRVLSIIDFLQKEIETLEEVRDVWKSSSGRYCEEWKNAETRIKELETQLRDRSDLGLNIDR